MRLLHTLEAEHPAVAKSLDNSVQKCSNAVRLQILLDVSSCPRIRQWRIYGYVGALLGPRKLRKMFVLT